jgi:copper chaperone CopZ
MTSQIHTVPGRLRVRSGALKEDPSCAEALNTMLRAIPGVQSVELRPMTGSIIVRYSTHRLSGDSIINTLAGWGFLTFDAQRESASALPLPARRTREIAVHKLLQRSFCKLIAGLL